MQRLSHPGTPDTAVRARLRALADPLSALEGEPRRALDEPDPDEALTQAPESDAGPVAVESDARSVAVAAARQFGRRHAAALAVLVAVGLTFGVWQLYRARSVPLAAASPAVVTPLTSARPSAAASSPAPVIVHVVGAVARPGVVTLAAGARVTDAVAAAGGLSDDADPAQLNLAAIVNDGDQIVIGRVGAPAGEVRGGAGGGQGAPAGASAGAGATATVNLNTATQAQLESLPGVGPVTAGKIMAWRTEHGRFTRVEELGEVDGIGPKTLNQIKPHVRV